MDNKYDIEEWIGTRGFEELTEAEKAIIINELGSQAAYTEMRKIVLSLQTENEEIIPSSVRHNIMDAFDLHHGSTEKKIIPIAKPRDSSYKKVIAYALLAASIIVGVFLILPDKSNSSNQQIAENKIKKEISSDSLEPTQNVKKEVENTEHTENLEMEQDIKLEPNAPALEDSKNQEKYKSETESFETDNENAQSFSAKSDKDYEVRDKAYGSTDAIQEMEEQSVAKIAAPPPPVQEMSLDQENEYSSERQQARGSKSLSKSKNAPVFRFKIESFTQNHYTSY